MQTMNLVAVEAATRGRILRGNPGLKLTGVSTDTRQLAPGTLFFALRGEQHDAHRFLADAARLGAAAAVVHEREAANQVGALPLLLVKDTTRALGDLAGWHRRRCPTTVIGITGSNGKTTTKEMLYHILDGVVRSVCSDANFNNAIGVPLTLFRVEPEDVFAVVEMGTNSPGEIARLCEIVDPDVGLITNIAEAHLEGLGSLEGIAREKSFLLKHTVRRGGAFYNADNYWSRRIAKSTRGSLYSFGIENEADVRAFNLRSDNRSISFKCIGGPRISIDIPGRHNALNALAAITVARKLGIDWNTISQRLATFQLPPMRMELRTSRNITFINDAYNANPSSMKAAAQTLHHMECEGRKILVVADMLELGDGAAESHRRLGKTIAQFGFDYLFGIGANAALLLESASEHGMDPRDVCLAASEQQLAETLLALAGAGDTVLFKGSRGMHLENTITLLQEGLNVTGDARRKVVAPVHVPDEHAGETGKNTAGLVEAPAPATQTVG